ncbi:EamA/RhaT family transporter [Stenotrophomonas sp. HITSZ_GD]|uniref:EamA family transporter n=1 Tax=Stenotrophomonas sp. HITSZ_GD TaxID=3037248 RepID=UPI00240E894F|nr:EamA family transporter [Stenotrophomonas sp. HITSZ_GD]MDG2523872.1 EamA/RhaT family transporter [Stenotrophomonas sp. HITSZ_GD]
MSFLLLSVLCSVLVSVLLKLAPRQRIDVAQAITWNYAVAGALALWLLDPSLTALRAPQTPWIELLLLAIALPSIFLVLARSVRLAGIVRSDVAQRLSLLLSLAAAFLWFGESAHPVKLAGLALGLLAIVGILHRPGTEATQARGWPWLLAVWAGFALIDVLLKRIALSGVSSLSSLTLCFLIAFALMLLVQCVRRLRGDMRFEGRSLSAGLLLGVLNFANILFYVRAHQALPDSPAVVFATMNIGVVTLGALVGILAFGEPTSRWNRAGLALAVVAIAIIAFAAKG